MISLYGITQDPDTSNYMIVMHEALGNLRNGLLTIKYNPNDKFKILLSISLQLKAIHKLNLIHGDFHSGNILNICHGISVISDLGLCRPVNQSSANDEIYGVLPYIAPEVLRGNPYTKAADIYSLGIIMWEMTSGVQTFHNISHDFQLALNICKGFRPEIIQGTIREYAELMIRCWDNNPNKRPTAKELVMIFDEWDDKYSKGNDNKERIPVPGNYIQII
jgi:serine/threonine protein kinase